MKNAYIALGALVIIGGGYLAYSKLVPSVDAALVMDKAMQSLTSIDSYTTRVDASFTMDIAPKGSEKGGKGDAKYLVTGAFSRKNESSQPDYLGKGQFHMDIDANFDGEEKIAMKPTIDFVFENKAFFLKFGLPKELTDIYPFVESLNNVWIKVDLDELANKGLIEKSQLDEIVAASSKRDPAVAAKLKDALVNSGIFKNISAKEGSPINGLDTLELSMNLDTSRISEFVLEYAKLADPEKAAQIKEEEKAQLDEMEAKAAEIIKDTRFTLTIEKESGFVRLASAKLGFADKDSGTAGSFDMSVAYNDINKSVTVEIPEQSTSIMTILAPFIGTLVPKTPVALPAR